jgi:hypothetical protein
MICPRIRPRVLRLLGGSCSHNRFRSVERLCFFVRGAAVVVRRWTWVSSLKQLALLLTPVCQLQQRRYTNPRQLRPAGKGFRQRCSLAELPSIWVHFLAFRPVARSAPGTLPYRRSTQLRQALVGFEPPPCDARS